LIRRFFVLALLIVATAAHAQVTLTRGTNFSVDIATDGRIAFDLLGKIWIIPPGGGVARQIAGGPHAARRPQWSADAGAIVFQARENGQEKLWLYDVGKKTARKLTAGQFFDHHPAWHPDATRIVYSSDRHDTGFDLWEYDLATGLTWRISSQPGDETEPAWSANGEDLLYIYRQDDVWSLMLRRRGQPERILESADVPLSSPSWRPDGSLVTFQRHTEDRIVTEMVILSEPLLIRPLIESEDLFVAPVSWQDRHIMIYAGSGMIRQREFNSWTPRRIPFRASFHPQTAPQAKPPEARQLPMANEPGGRLVVRSARLFDGLGGGYRHGMDIVMEGGRIVAVEPHADRPGAIVVDMGDLTAIPGMIDSRARMSGDIDASLGPVLLSFGLTTLVADIEDVAALNETWSGKDMPGPRVLGADWMLDFDTVATMNLSIDSLPTSPRGIRYEDAQLTDSTEPATVLSGLADARTPGLPALLRSRQAAFLKGFPTALRRSSEAPQLASQSSSIVLGSAANGLPPGIGLHAELRALAGAGLDEEHVLRTAGINAARALGLGLSVGRIAPGASADIVIVDGDPLGDVTDALNVVGVVRNGRFFSTIGLLERVQEPQSVE
jgi:hypothetical protein